MQDLSNKKTINTPKHSSPKLVRCEFCGDLFCPRAQTKNPRACTKKECQEKRKKANKREWREKNKFYYPPEYHAKQRKSRHKKLHQVANSLSKCLEIGSAMLDMVFNKDNLKDLLLAFFIKLGIRRLQKTCDIGLFACKA